MQQFFTLLISRFKAVEQKRAALLDKTILALELVYLRLMRSDRPAFKDVMLSTYKIVVAHILLPEFYLLVFGISLLVVSNGSFMEPEVDYGKLRPLIIVFSSIIAGVIPLILAFVTVPFHIAFHISLWVTTAFHVVIASVVFSTLQPHFASLFFSDGIASFRILVVPMMIFYGLAEFYLLSLLHKRLSYNLYRERHSQLQNAGFIPVEKQGKLISMSAKDHYVEFTTEHGTHLERITMKKAVEIPPHGEGIQVHRSHWVAYSSILTMEKESEKHVVSLRNGVTIPVGKMKVAALQAYLDNR